MSQIQVHAEHDIIIQVTDSPEGLKVELLKQVDKGLNWDTVDTSFLCIGNDYKMTLMRL
jgi:hypothetical protein